VQPPLVARPTVRQASLEPVHPKWLVLWVALPMLVQVLAL
jgi:hypothetical protein